MKRDQLSDVFDLIEVAGMVSGGFSVRGDWFCRLEIKDPVKMIGVVCGRVRLATDGYGPIDLEPGDVAILNGCTQVVLKGGPGAAPRRSSTSSSPGMPSCGSTAPNAVRPTSSSVATST
ncbi:cupin domain-containing protein [Mycolicibacterium vanbaalenii]|uniref:cupin domain-containing protein n=1 Tax=Mycolicibacterium vanbaalenii TaxID=110539 RepID=UPI0021F2FB8D|nr:cupin domain-containing protein [Mycolicibacterium vanbaalenii]